MIENKRFAVLVTSTLFLLILAGCEKAAESTQKAVQDTKEMTSGVAEKVTEDIKEGAAKVIETPSETVSEVVDEIKDGAGAITENTTELAADTVEGVADTAEGVKETATELLDASTETVAGVVDEAKETLAVASISKDDALALAKKSGCLACHKIDDKLVGPAWKDVATRYKDDPQAKSLLIEKVSKGGKGNWTEVTGGAPMPPNSPRVSDEDIDKLVTFVLSL